MKEMFAVRNVLMVCLAAVLCAYPYAGKASEAGRAADALFVISDLVRSCDTAYEVLKGMGSDDKNFVRCDREWRDLEKRLEAQRVLAFAGLAGLSEAVILDLRRQWGWDYLCDKYRIDRRKFYYGFSPYDRERDKWKGVPPGLAKKDGLPPGQAKKVLKEKKHKK